MRGVTPPIFPWPYPGRGSLQQYFPIRGGGSLPIFSWPDLGRGVTPQICPWPDREGGGHSANIVLAVSGEGGGSLHQYFPSRIRGSLDFASTIVLVCFYLYINMLIIILLLFILSTPHAGNWPHINLVQAQGKWGGGGSPRAAGLTCSCLLSCSTQMIVPVLEDFALWPCTSICHLLLTCIWIFT